MKDPEAMLSDLGFGQGQYSLLLNQVRGWNTALLGISIFGFIKGSKSKDFFLLASITSALTTYAHIMTALHHVNDEKMQVVLKREKINPWGPAMLTTLLGLISGWAYFKAT
mmetsp:Transcript_66686/g.178356  ORF Transcript_66686/g.178356 Transcript_66686/m.178356 type:complete len:111 (-) Transcript_66686:121-453(-)